VHRFQTRYKRRYLRRYSRNDADVDSSRVTEVKLGKGVNFYYFSLITSRLHGALATATSQFANQNFCGFSHVFRPDVSSTHVVAFRDIGQDLATGTQRLVAHCVGPAPQEWADPAEEIAEKFADPLSSLKVKRDGIDGTDSRSSKPATSLFT